MVSGGVGEVAVVGAEEEVVEVVDKEAPCATRDDLDDIDALPLT